MCFALVCTIGMLKFTGQSDCSENKRMFTQSFYIHMSTSYWQWWSEMILPNHATYTLLYFSQLWTFECGKAQSRSSMHSKPQQQPTLLYFFILFCYFFIFLNFWEQVWAKLGSFWHTDQQCNTLINCEQNDCGKAKSYSQRVTTTKWRHPFFVFFHFHHDMFGTNDDSTKKWKKVKKCEILSKIEQDLPGPQYIF